MCKCEENRGETMVKELSNFRNKKLHSSKPYDVSNVSKLAYSHHFARNAENRSGSKIITTLYRGFE